MSKHVYIFTEDSLAAKFGVGRYIQTILDIIQKYTSYSITIVNLLQNRPDVIIYQSNNVRYINIPAVKKGKSTYYRNVAYLLVRYIDTNEDIIFHYNFMGCYQLAKYLRILFIRSASLLTLHYSDCDIYNIESKELRLAESNLVSICDKIIVMSSYRRYYIENNYSIPHERVVLLKHQLPPQSNKMRNTNKAAISKPFILFVGRLDDNKGISILLDAFKRVISNFEKLSLVIVGDGPLLSSLLRSSISVSQRVIFTGYLDNNDVQSLYKDALLGVIPSRYEEYGLVATEMKDAGLPIIANCNWGLSSSLAGYDKTEFVSLNSTHSKEGKVEILAEALLKNVEKLIGGAITAKESRELSPGNKPFEDYSYKMIALYNEISRCESIVF
ncbi:MAG: glycosyltransferase [Bacteroides sp.]|nr:glycosyltransferase [Bacteroides sp.]